MKYCVLGTQSVPNSRLKLKLPHSQLDPISLTDLDQKLKKAVTVVGFVCTFTFLQRVLQVEVSDSLRDGSTEVIDDHFKAFSLCMS